MRLKIFHQYSRLFHENSFTDWNQFETLPDFDDRKFDPTKLNPMIGFRRAGITNELLNDPYQLHEYIYGDARSGYGFFLKISYII